MHQVQVHPVTEGTSHRRDQTGHTYLLDACQATMSHAVLNGLQGEWISWPHKAEHGSERRSCKRPAR